MRLVGAVYREKARLAPYVMPRAGHPQVTPALYAFQSRLDAQPGVRPRAVVMPVRSQPAEPVIIAVPACAARFIWAARRRSSSRISPGARQIGGAGNLHPANRPAALGRCVPADLRPPPISGPGLVLRLSRQRLGALAQGVQRLVLGASCIVQDPCGPARLGRRPSPCRLRAFVCADLPSMPFSGYPAIAFPAPAAASQALGAAILGIGSGPGAGWKVLSCSERCWLIRLPNFCIFSFSALSCGDWRA